MVDQELASQSAKLKRKLTVSASEVQSINEMGRQARDDNTQHSAFKGMFRAIEKYYTQFESTWDQLVELHEDAGKPQDFPTANDKLLQTKTKRYYYEANTAYEEMQAQFQTQLAAAKPPANPNATLNQDTSTVPARATKILPRINLPNFDGQVTNWPKFRDTFISLIHNDTCVSNMEKFHYLISSLTDSARAVISNIPLLDTNYTLAWTTLQQTYNNERMLASAYLNKLIDYKPQTGKPNVQTLQHFLTQVTDNLSAFNLLKINNKTDFILFHMAVRCLDPFTREQFEIHHKGIDFPTFDDLTKFMRDRVLALQLANANDHRVERNDKFTPSTLNKTNKPYQGQRYKTTLLSNTTESNFRSDPCVVCKDKSHYLFKCPKFTGSTVDERHNLLRGWKGCRNCLRSGHTTKQCASSWTCRICKLKHSTMLHQTNPNLTKDTKQINYKSKQEEAPTQSCSSSTSLSSTLLQESNVLLGTVAAEIQDASGLFQHIRLVVDSGSQQSFMSAACFKRLGLTSSPYPKKISAIGQTIFEGSKGKVSCVIKPKNAPTPLLKTEAVVVSQITSYLPNFTLPRHVWHQYTTYQLADPDFWKPGPIDFLLGADLFPDILTGAIITLNDEKPKLFASIFGHIVIGKTVPGLAGSTGSTFFTTTSQSDDLLNQLKGFWEIEEPLNIKGTPTPEEQMCEEHFKQTHRRLKSGQYVVRLPFKEDSQSLHSFERNSLKRFYNLETKLDNNVNLKSQYHDFMHEYEDLGHMNITDTKSKFIIPHHCVLKQNQSNTKLRVVFDASAQTTHGKSLNDCLLAGPKLQADIKDILMRFRLHPVVFVTDIVKMFRNILIDDNDRSFQHIWWRFNNNTDVRKYQLNTVTYGLTCSPFLAQRVMQQLALDDGNNFPKASQAITQDMYVDDIVTGVFSISEALELQKQLVDLLKRGHFKLSKWSSNRKEILEAVQQDTKENINFSSQEDGAVKILGLQWNPNTDSFSYHIKPVKPVYTKRAILSTIAKIYDPLGFLAPFVLLAKSIIQDLWKIKLDWDDEVPLTSRQLWDELLTNLHLLQDLRIPRFTACDYNFKIQIIGFSDASNKGYCAALYLRCISSTSVNTYLLTAKTKLSPLKTISIPRLELNGALLLSRLYQSTSKLSEQFSGEVLEPYFFTDSTIVLCWLQTPPHNLKVFVANRVAEITTTTPLTSWLHIPTTDNPSDCGSRGLTPKMLITHPLWWTGPSWLQEPIEKWPIHNLQKRVEDLPELKPNTNTLLTIPADNTFVEWMTTFSSFDHLLRVIGWILRFTSRLKRQDNKIVGPLSVQELCNALTLCVKIIQLHLFFEGDLNRNTTKVFDRFLRLSPFLDEDGVLRVGGRLTNSCISENQRHPILLPKCHFTVILVDYYHRIYLHPGPSLLQAAVQLKYWIPSLRSLVRQRTFKCITCYKRKAKTFPPKMADLPPCRVQPSRPFLHVGVDFAGPMLIRESLRRKAQVYKAYICLFVCMSTKAIHLELVTNLSTEAFLACLHRFTSRRGLPEHIYSDNGTNFQGAANKIKELYLWYKKTTVQENIIQYAAKKGIQWHFNPPHAPHFGGLWEAGVKSTKTILHKIAGNAMLTYEELYTLLTQVEAALNSRPLCPLSASPEETNYLSPGHFLIGGHLLDNPEPSLLERKDHALTRWQLVQKTRDHFWKRWRQEYLSTLQKRFKWMKPQEDLKTGDLVLLKEKNMPFLHWPLAKIQQVHPGKDGVVRVVTLKTQDSTLKRPTVQLVPLIPLKESHYQF